MAEKKLVHILMIDDDPAMLRLFGSQLVNHGFEVLPAHDGNEGREMARRFQPDLIMVDQNMPVMDGLEVISRVKSEDITKNIPIILFTNQDLSMEAENLIKESGANDYMHKGSPIEEIVARINKLLLPKAEPEVK